jgi:uncharacterized delta-60 repeat protein
MRAPGRRSIFRWLRVFGGLPLLLALSGYLAASPGTAAAAAGRPDRSFGQGSLVAARFGPSFLGSSFTSVEATPGDGVVMWQYGPKSAGGFQGYTPGGSLQPAAASPALGSLRAVEPDGKTIEVERASAESKGTIRRRLPDGQLDPSFGNGGQEALPYFSESGPDPARPERLLALPSGKLIVAGTALFREEIGARTTTREYEVAVLRLDEDGKADPTFGSGGVVKTRTDLGIDDVFAEARGVAARQGEALVLAMTGSPGGELIGLTAGGALDKSFGSGGTVGVKSTIEDIHSNAEGKILVAGTGSGPISMASIGSDFFVSRFEDDGQPDPSYGEGGTTFVDFGGAADTLGAVLWEPDGSALLGGAFDAAEPGCTALGLCEETPVLARLAASGQLDSGFGEGGKIRLSQLTESADSERAAGILALAARPDGGAYAAGASGTAAFVAALGPSGNPVAGFGEGGILTATYPRAGSSSIADVAVDDKRRILVLGQTSSGSEPEAARGGFVRRLLPNGKPDPSYAGGAEFARVPSDATRIVVDRRGGALVLSGNQVVRLNPSGAVDGSFAGGGALTPRPRPNAIVRLHAIAVLPSGKFLVAGSLGFVRPRIIVYRFNADGSPDPSFGHHGWTVLRLGKRSHDLAVSRLLGEADGRVLVGGFVKHHHGNSKTRTMMVARLLPDGRPDRGFGRGGAIFPEVGPESEVSGLALEHGEILVAGTQRSRGRATMVILGYRDDGRLDRGFGKSGVIREPARGEPLTGADSSVSLLVTPRRLIAVSGSLPDPVSAYRPDGVPILGYGRGKGVVPAAPGKGPPTEGPVATLQGARPILAWTAVAGSGAHQHGSTGWIQRLTAR